MKKIVVWSWRYVLSISAFILFLVYWCCFAYKNGYAEQVSFWLFFPLILLFFGLILWRQFTIIEIKDQQVILSHFGKLRKRIFEIQHVSASRGDKTKPSPRAPSMYPIYIYDNHSNKTLRIVCGRIRGAAFDIFWREIDVKTVH